LWIASSAAALGGLASLRQRRSRQAFRRSASPGFAGQLRFARGLFDVVPEAQFPLGLALDGHVALQSIKPQKMTPGQPCCERTPIGRGCKRDLAAARIKPRAAVGRQRPERNRRATEGFRSRHRLLRSKTGQPSEKEHFAIPSSTPGFGSIVNSHFGQAPKSFTINPKRAFTIRRNRRSRSFRGSSSVPDLDYWILR
jgi:hypothetical protein